MSTPTFDPDDPRLTAYALGEAGDADRRAVEEMLESSAAARTEIEQTQAFARLLDAEYRQENEQYAAAREKVVPFPLAGRSRWRRGVVPLLQAAAAVAIVASALSFGLKSMRRLATPAVSSVTSGEATRRDRLDTVQAPAAAAQNATPAASMPELLAKESRQATVFDEQPVSRAEVDQPAAAAAAPPMPVATGIATGSSMDKPTKAGASDEPAARYVVRVRAADGSFFGGAVVSTDGLILSSTSLPDEIMRRPCTVSLPDGREFPGAAERSQLGPGWYWLRIGATGLPAASPATEPPSAGATLTTALVDPRSGSLTLSHLRPSQIQAQGAAFAFDPAGAFLIVSASDRPQGPGGSAKAYARRASPAAPSVRPLTPAEREIIERAASRLSAP